MFAAPLLLACLLAPPADPGEPPAADVTDEADATPGDPGASEPLTGLALRRQSAAELEAALDAPLPEAVDFRPETSVADVLDRLFPDQTMRPDGPRLDLEGIDLRDLPLYHGLRLPAGRFPRRTALEEVLAQAEIPLTYLNDGGILRITTQDYADERLLMRTYAVRDLLEAAGPSAAARRAGTPFGPSSMGMGSMGMGLSGAIGPPANSVEGETRESSPTDADAPPATELEIALAAEQPLIDVILTTTGGIDQGGGWEEIDGEGGSLEFFNGLLTVRQTEAVHRQIAHLLADLRAADAGQPWTVPLTLPETGADPAKEPTE